MTEEKLVTTIVDNFCECLIEQLDYVLHYTCSECGSQPLILIDRNGLIELIQNIKQDYHDEEEIVEILNDIYNK